MSDPLELDQEDFVARLQSDPYFADITVLLQRKGVTDSEILSALSTLNEKASKTGVVVVVLMPVLEPRAEGAPGPEYRVVLVVQVLESPLFNDAADGTGKSAEAISTRVRQVLHYFDTGARATYNFAGQGPLPAPDGVVSYAVRFARGGRDERPDKVATPAIAPNGGAAPQSVTLTCATAGATIYYTIDGSAPFSGNAAAVAYAGPIALDDPATLRAAAELAGAIASNIATAIFT